MTTSASHVGTLPRIALVTGANKDIGLAIAAGLLRESFTVYLGARDAERSAAAITRGDERAWVGQPDMAYSSSKTALNAVTVHFARELAGTPIKVNGAAPGHVATDFNQFRGERTPEQGAAVAIWLATLPADGPTGAVFQDRGQLAW